MAIQLKQSNRSLCVAFAAALIGMVLYILTSTTGYLAGTTLNIWPILCTAAALLLAAVLLLAEKKLPSIAGDILLIASALLLIVSFSLFVLGRVSLVADVHFIPVNYPQSEEVALNISLVGIALYLLSILVMIAVAFSGKFGKK